MKMTLRKVILKSYEKRTVQRFRKRRRSPIFQKCEDLMEQLWEDGYRREISWKDLRHYVEMVCGAFRTTVADYLGKRATYYKSRGRAGVLKSPSKPGYLENFGFIQKKSPKLVCLLHERVDRPYHYLQTDMEDFSLSFSAESNERNEGAVAPTIDGLHTTTTLCEREIRESESIPRRLTAEEQVVLRSATGEWG